MPQTTVPSSLVIRPVNVTGDQEQINLGVNSKIAIGNPGGPVVFASNGVPIITQIFGGLPRSVVGAK